MRVLAIPGSLRSQSKNRALLDALAMVAPQTFEIRVYGDLSAIQPFNPDLEQEADTGAVARFREAITASAVVLFSTPEYAHGIPGALKNALDWIVGTGELSRKPVALLQASTRAVYARASLIEVLTAMDARLLIDAEVALDLGGDSCSAREIAENANWRRALLQSLETIAALA